MFTQWYKWLAAVVFLHLIVNTLRPLKLQCHHYDGLINELKPRRIVSKLSIPENCHKVEKYQEKKIWCFVKVICIWMQFIYPIKCWNDCWMWLREIVGSVVCFYRLCRHIPFVDSMMYQILKLTSFCCEDFSCLLGFILVNKFWGETATCHVEMKLLSSLVKS